MEALQQQLVVLLFIIAGMLFTLLIFIALDYWAGIRKAHKRGDKIRSDKMKRTVDKISRYYNDNALYVTMSMISSDSGDTIVSNMNANGVNMDRDSLFKFIYHLALDKLKDKDHMFNLRNYFKL